MTQRPLDNRLAAAEALVRAGDLSAAERAARKVAAANPRNVPALHLLGIIAFQRGQLDDAITHFLRGVALAPDLPILQFNLGNALRDKGRLDEAAACYDRVAALQPNFVAAHLSKAYVFVLQRKFDDAAAAIEYALKLAPGNAQAHNDLAYARSEQGRHHEAVAHYKRAIALAPTDPKAYNNLGIALLSQKKPDEAVPYLERAVALEPAHGNAMIYLANALLQQGRTAEARKCLERELALRPQSSQARSNLLFCLNYFPDISREEMAAAHNAFGQLHAPPLATLDLRFATTPERERRLRVGYVSCDFRLHSVAFFAAPLLEAHDHTQFEIFCYADLKTPDEFTARFIAAADHWTDIYGWTDDAVVARVRADAIDILVDLSGHTGPHRLAVFARKPAPVQFTWLGYPNTTGLKAIDYRITDAIADPPDDCDQYYSETLVRLPRCFVSYRATDDVDVTPLPALATAQVTFGSFNNVNKLNAQVIALWARVLNAIPNARLLLKADGLAGQLVRERFAAEGIKSPCLEIAPYTQSHREHLGHYGRVDIALDTFPYNGTTTTCEALWMGVPVITLRGDRHAGRAGESLLRAVGLPELVAENVDAFVAIAVDLARNLDRLQSLRAGLRDRMRRSALCDADGLARAMETAYRNAWRHWCHDHGPAVATELPT